MFRAISYSLILCGLIIAGFGVYSVVSTQRAEQEAQEQWDRQMADRPADRPAAPELRREVQKGEMLARLSIDRLKSQWVVLEGADHEGLKRGPGHLSDTALPGGNGNCVIAGHRDTQFRVLRNVEIGEEISLETEGRTFFYRVTDRRVVAPTDTSSLDHTATPTLTLVTCYPFYYVGPAPKRFIVRAELISSRA
jgi:sortase A